MEKTLLIQENDLAVPVYTAHLDFSELLYCRLEEVTEGAPRFLTHFLLPYRKGAEAPDYEAFLPVGDLRGKTVRITIEERGGETDREAAKILAGIHTGKAPQYPAGEGNCYFAPYGWINDPNGCILRDGVWHLYFQHNPMNREWTNMSWGHAVSRDGLHFAFVSDVMFPDENGLMFSGCAIANDRGCFGLPKSAILYFYTASHDPTRLGAGVHNTQRLAYSLDGGNTLIKYKDWYFPYPSEETRDPKIFWHEESGYYICVLYLGDWQFGIFRSKDLANWEQTQVIEEEPMWECPDLFPLRGTFDGKEITKWFFTSADGYYYAGDFDGKTFRKEGKRRMLYGTKLPYAAQTFSGTGDRTIAVAWLRTKNLGKIREGAMSRLRTFALDRDGDGYYIRQAFLVDSRAKMSCENVSSCGLQERISEDGKLYFAEQI